MYLFNFKSYLFTLLLLGAGFSMKAQNDTLNSTDTSSAKLNMDAIYDRPTLTLSKIPVSIGGYLEANTQYEQTDGVSEGFSFQMRRFTIFMASSIAKNIKFLSEIEFEDGAKVISLETALIDFEFHPLLNLRGGIILVPIGAFNQNHDSPKWDFIDRPLASTTILPATLSSVGFGLHGKGFFKSWVFGYEVYLTNGFDDQIISNPENRTSLAAGKSNPFRFEESNSGLPMLSGKISVRKRKVAEFGISYMQGVYNKWKIDGLVVDSKRSAGAAAFDFNLALYNGTISINGEAAKVFVDVPRNYIQSFGTEQAGGFIDVVATVLKRKVFNWEKSTLSAGIRTEYVDYNLDQFNETGGKIHDDVWAFVPSVAFRPVSNTVLRFNYRYEFRQDFIGNPETHTAVIQFGFASYF